MSEWLQKRTKLIGLLIHFSFVFSGGQTNTDVLPVKYVHILLCYLDHIYTSYLTSPLIFKYDLSPSFTPGSTNAFPSDCIQRALLASNANAVRLNFWCLISIRHIR